MAELNLSAGASYNMLELSGSLGANSKPVYVPITGKEKLYNPIMSEELNSKPEVTPMVETQEIKTPEVKVEESYTNIQPTITPEPIQSIQSNPEPTFIPEPIIPEPIKEIEKIEEPIMENNLSDLTPPVDDEGQHLDTPWDKKEETNKEVTIDELLKVMIQEVISNMPEKDNSEIEELRAENKEIKEKLKALEAKYADLKAIDKAVLEAENKVTAVSNTFTQQPVINAQFGQQPNVQRPYVESEQYQPRAA